MQKVLKSYEDLDKKFKVTFELIEKNLNEHQISLYNAFILKAANHFGNSFVEMEVLLSAYHPKMTKVPFEKWTKTIDKWTTLELDTFINQASASLAKEGFSF